MIENYCQKYPEHRGPSKIERSIEITDPTLNQIRLCLKIARNLKELRIGSNYGWMKGFITILQGRFLGLGDGERGIETRIILSL